METIKIIFRTPTARTISGFIWFLAGLVFFLYAYMPKSPGDETTFEHIYNFFLGTGFMFGGLKIMINARNPVYGKTQQIKEDTADFVKSMMQAKNMSDDDIDLVTNKIRARKS